MTPSHHATAGVGDDDVRRSPPAADAIGEHWRIVEAAMKAAFPALIAIVSWGTLEVIAHGNRLTALEANRYTQNDAANDQKALVAKFEEVAKALHSIDRQVAELVARNGSTK